MSNDSSNEGQGKNISQIVPEEPLYTAYLEGELLLNRFGKWFHNGSEFQHKRLISYFHRSIEWEPKRASFAVRIGVGRAYFTCEDTAFFVRELHEQNIPWQISLLNAQKEELDLKSLCIGDEDQVYCTNKAGFRTRFLRNAHQALLPYVVSENQIRVGSELITLSAIRI